jgi:hypothetical protein
MTFVATKSFVSNRGSPPDAFLEELVSWGRNAADDIFESRPNPNGPDGVDPDIYAHIMPILGPWQNLLHRRAAMLEVMRVHAGFESSWHWNEGVDVTNQSSLHNKNGEETGIFQVSFDSTFIAGGAMKPFATAHGIAVVDAFIPAMKVNHSLALEYYARLIRISTRWAGPLIRHEIDPWLSRHAVAEFQLMLS